jgi:glycosyltransferase involved in cell wall biosynthesis
MNQGIGERRVNRYVSKPRVMIVVNTAWNVFNFRTGLIRALVGQGHEVIAVAPFDSFAPRLAELGCRYVPLAMDNQGTNPTKDLLLLWRFYRLLGRERPDVFLGYTVKPNVYGSLAAHSLGIPVINNIAGLGAVFINDSLLTRLVRGLYRVALKRSAKVFFQNEDDREMFISGGLVPAGVTDRVPGSGVDLVRFSIQGGLPWVVEPPLPNTSPPMGEGLLDSSDDATGEENIRFLLIARMLWDKGVGEFVEAARMVQTRYPNAEFCLLGFLDVQNPAAISRDQMEKWVTEGVVNYLGEAENIRPHLLAADCVVLPSYREGTPRTLLEAAAMARPIITTDSVGCRDVVDDGVNGFLCRPRDASDLAEKMARMISMSQAEREAMGLRGREKIEREFDEKIVIDKYLAAIEAVLAGDNIAEPPNSPK